MDQKNINQGTKQTWSEYLDKINDEDKHGMLVSPVDGQTCLNFLSDYLLGEDWYCSTPMSQGQINSVIVSSILKLKSLSYRLENIDKSESSIKRSIYNAFLATMKPKTKQSWSEYLDKINDEDKYGMLVSPVDGQTCLNFLSDYLLGEDWYCSTPLSQGQINSVIVSEILGKYSKEFSQEIYNIAGKQI